MRKKVGKNPKVGEYLTEILEKTYWSIKTTRQVYKDRGIKFQKAEKFRKFSLKERKLDKIKY